MASSTNESTPPRILIGEDDQADAADAEQVGERRQRERERERQAQCPGHEETDDEHDQRGGAGDEWYQDGGDGETRRCRATT